MKIWICRGKSCTERGSEYVKKRLLSDIAQLSPDDEIEDILCQGKCQMSVNVVYNGVCVSHLNPVKAAEELKRRISKTKKPWK